MLCYTITVQRTILSTPLPRSTLFVNLDLTRNGVKVSWLNSVRPKRTPTWNTIVVLKKTPRGTWWYDWAKLSKSKTLYGGVFAQRAHSAHSASYYGVYPGNSPENLPPLSNVQNNAM